MQWRLLRGLLKCFFWTSWQELRLLGRTSWKNPPKSVRWLEKLGIFFSNFCGLLRIFELYSCQSMFFLCFSTDELSFDWLKYGQFSRLDLLFISEWILVLRWFWILNDHFREYGGVYIYHIAYGCCGWKKQKKQNHSFPTKVLCKFSLLV